MVHKELQKTIKTVPIHTCHPQTNAVAFQHTDEIPFESVYCVFCLPRLHDLNKQRTLTCAILGIKQHERAHEYPG